MRTCIAVLVLLALAAGLSAEDNKKEDGWIELFNGKNTSGWKLRAEKVTVTRFQDSEGKVIKGAKRGKVDQKEVIQDNKGKEIKDAKVIDKDGKKVIVDGDGKLIPKAKIVKTGGREVVLDSAGKEVKDAVVLNETVPNPLGWTVEKGVLVCSSPHGGNDLLTEQKFKDFELHVEFLSTSNSGVYLQGRYEIQIINDHGQKPNTHSCGSLYGQIAPSKNVNKKSPEWNTYHVTYRAPRGKDNKVTEKARVTLVWNGEKVIDDKEINGPTGAALDNKVLEPGPILLQGDHGKVSFRNIKIKPLDK